MIDLDALRKMPPGHLEAGPAEPGAARPFFLAAQQSDRPLSLPEDLPAKPVGAAARRSSVRPPDRGHDAALGRAALAAVGTALPVVEQVLRGLSRPHDLVRGLARPGPGEVQPLLDDPDLPFREPGDDHLEGFADDDGGRDDDDGAGAPDAGHLQAVQSQEMARSAPDLFRPSRAWRSWQAGQDLASRGIPTPQNLAFLSRRRSFKSDPLFWFLPHETYLITVKEEDAVDLATYVSEVLPSLPPDVRRARIRSLTGSLAALDPIAARAVALAPRPEGVEHPDQDRSDRRRAISSA